MIVAHDEITVRFVDPDDAAPRIADKIIVKNGRPFGWSLTETGHQIADVLLGVEVE